MRRPATRSCQQPLINARVGISNSGRQRVGFDDRKPARERVAICRSAQPFTGCLFAVARGALAVFGSELSLLRGLHPVASCTFALSGCADDDLRAGDGAD